MSQPYWTPGFVDPAVKSPPVESMAVAFLAPKLSPTPVATRLPRPDVHADTVNGFLRVEAAGGSKANFLEFRRAIIGHAYCPDEMWAEELANEAFGWLAAARGQSITVGASSFFVVEVTATIAPTRLSDPNVNLPRYRFGVSWRVVGRVMVPGGS